MSNSNNPFMNISVDAERNYLSNLNADNLRYMFQLETYVEYGNNTIKKSNMVFLDFNNEFLDVNYVYKKKLQTFFLHALLHEYCCICR